TGWYYSPAGGGAAFRPTGGERVTVHFDNTETTKADGAVPTIFNGDFEQGTRQSLYNFLTGGDKGRFPVSYEIPGWSFHGGSGFDVDLGAFIGYPIDRIDVSGLMLLQTNPTTIFKDGLLKLIDKFASQIMDYFARGIAAKKEGLPSRPPADTSSIEYQAWLVAYGPNSDSVKRIQAALKFVEKVDNWIKLAVDAQIWTGQVTSFEQAFSKLADPTQAELDGLTALLKTAMGAMIDKLFAPESNFALLMGGEKALGSLVLGMLDGMIAVDPDDPTYPLIKDYVEYVLEEVTDFTGIEHNRLYVPHNANFLTFETFSPWLVTPNVELFVTITPINPEIGSFAKSIPLEPGFWETTNHVIELPDAYRGKIVTISFEHKNSEEVIHALSDWMLPPQLEARVLFPFDKFAYADLTQESKDILEAQAEYVFNNPEVVQVQILGYTDARGDEDYNFELGLKRAQTVTHYIRQYLIDRGEDPTRVLAPISMGEQEAKKLPGAGEATLSLERNTLMKVVIEASATNGEIEPNASEPLSR